MLRRFPSLSFSVLRNRDFRLLLMGRLFASMALQAQAVIVGWQIYSLTHDALMLGLAGLAEAMPALVSALFAGHVVDINRPHRIYLLSIGALALNALMLLLIAGGHIHASQGSIVAWIFAGVFFSGIARSFVMPASFAIFQQTMPRHDLAAGYAWSASGMQLATITAPAIAGLIYGGYGPSVAWLIPAGLLYASFFMLAFMGEGPRAYKSERKNEPTLQSIRAGWNYILKSPVVLSIMALDMFGVLFGGATALLPVYADAVLHVGSEGLGILRAAPAIGAIVVGLTLAVRPLRHLRGTMLLAVVTGFGLSMIGFGVSTSFPLSLLFLAVSGAFDNVSMVMRGTILQILTPPDMRGRVSGINSMFIISSNELGAFESGVAAKLLGLVPSVVLGGLMTLGIVAATACLTPQLRKMKIDSSAKE